LMCDFAPAVIFNWPYGHGSSDGCEITAIVS
jgi:hypothetical protein